MNTVKALLVSVMFLLLVCGDSDSEPPTVHITYPLTNSMVGGTVDITIDASDNDAVERVELFIDDALAATLTEDPYTYAWTTDSLVNNSIHALVARAYDLTGNESAYDTVNVEIFNDTTGLSIFIWLYDPLDRFYDAAVGDSVDCGYWLQQMILANGYTPETGITLPSSLDDYDVLFVTLGWFRGC